MNGYYSVDELNDIDPYVLELPRDFLVKTNERYILHEEFFGLWVIIIHHYPSFLGNSIGASTNFSSV